MEDKQQQQQQPIFTLSVNLDQVNVILATLGKLPYETIAPLMAAIRGQVEQQISEMNQVQQSSQEPTISSETFQ